MNQSELLNSSDSQILTKSGRSQLRLSAMSGTLIAGRGLETETLLSLTIEVADALDAAHAAGIVHPGTWVLDYR